MTSIMANKLAITVWNYKGGVGKTTISIILAEIAVQQGLHVLAIDLDEQMNLSETLKLNDSLSPFVEVHTSLLPEFADEDFDLFIIDTHPAKDETIKAALQFADIVLIPVLGDYLSIINLHAVFDFVIASGVGTGQIAIVKNCMNELKISDEVEHVLDEQGYSSAGRLPRSNILAKNIASGEKWDKFMRPQQQQPFREFYSRIWNAYSALSAGKFYNLWKV